MLHWSERHCKPEILQQVFEGAIRREMRPEQNQSQLMHVIYQNETEMPRYQKDHVYDPRR